MKNAIFRAFLRICTMCLSLVFADAFITTSAFADVDCSQYTGAVSDGNGSCMCGGVDNWYFGSDYTDCTYCDYDISTFEDGVGCVCDNGGEYPDCDEYNPEDDCGPDEYWDGEECVSDEPGDNCSEGYDDMCGMCEEDKVCSSGQKFVNDPSCSCETIQTITLHKNGGDENVGPNYLYAVSDGDMGYDLYLDANATQYLDQWGYSGHYDDGKITIPQRDGYVFAGYYANPTAEELDDDPDAQPHLIVESDGWLHPVYDDDDLYTNLYAQWAPAQTATLRQNAGADDNVNATVTVGNNAAMPSVDINGTTLTVPTRSGYLFNGYFDARDGGTKYYNSDMTSAHLWTTDDNGELYAQWLDINSIDYKFTLTTTNLSANDSFSWKITASGEFIFDCGTGGTFENTGNQVAMVTRSNTNQSSTYTCNYANAGVHTIRFTGNATGYNYSNTAISFNLRSSEWSGTSPSSDTNATKIASISGSLGQIFGTIPNYYYAPNFGHTFAYATNLKTIPTNLFDGVTNTSYYGQLSYTFYGCSGLNEFTDGTNTYSYVPGLFLANLAGSSDSDYARQMFYGTGFASTCPAGTYTVTRTNYQRAGKPWCSACPDGYTSPEGSTSADACYALQCGENEIAQNGICVCDASNNYYGNAGSCIQCSNGYDNQCGVCTESCESGEIWDAAICGCHISCGEHEKWENNACVCDASNNYYGNAGSCVQCSNGYDNQCGVCMQSCDEGYSWDTDTCGCKSVCGEHEIYDSAWGCHEICKGGSYWGYDDMGSPQCVHSDCTNQQYWDNTNEQCVNRCPDGQEFDTDFGNCHEQCKGGSHWGWDDADDLTCVNSSCEYGYRWDNSAEQCVARCSEGATWYGEMYGCQSCPDAQEFDGSYGGCHEVCKGGSYWGDAGYATYACIHNSCTSDQYWDNTNEQCVNRCPDGQTYDWSYGGCHEICNGSSYWDGTQCYCDSGIYDGNDCYVDPCSVDPSLPGCQASDNDCPTLDTDTEIHGIPARTINIPDANINLFVFPSHIIKYNENCIAPVLLIDNGGNVWLSYAKNYTNDITEMKISPRIQVCNDESNIFATAEDLLNFYITTVQSENVDISNYVNNGTMDSDGFFQGDHWLWSYVYSPLWRCPITCDSGEYLYNDDSFLTCKSCDGEHCCLNSSHTFTRSEYNDLGTYEGMCSGDYNEPDAPNDDCSDTSCCMETDEMSHWSDDLGECVCDNDDLPDNFGSCSNDEPWDSCGEDEYWDGASCVQSEDCSVYENAESDGDGGCQCMDGYEGSPYENGCYEPDPCDEDPEGDECTGCHGDYDLMCDMCGSDERCDDMGENYFWDSDSCTCATCGENAHYSDMYGDCVCDGAGVYDEGTCEPQPDDCTVYTGSIENEENKCVCDTANNYYGDNYANCIYCPADHTWTGYECRETCKGASYWSYDSISKEFTCMNSSCSESLGMRWDNTTETCVSRCGENEEWDNSRKTCRESCDEHSYWDTYYQKCVVQCSDFTGATYTDNYSCMCNESEHYYGNYTNCVHCNPETHVWNGTTCVPNGCQYYEKYNTTTGTCEPKCSNGVYGPTSPYLKDIIGASEAVDNGNISHEGKYSNSWNYNKYNLTQNGTFVVDYGDKGKVWGHTHLSTTPGVYLYDWKTDTTIELSIADNISEQYGREDAQYCWCQITGYTPNGGSKQNVTTPWVFVGTFDGFLCSSECIDKLNSTGTKELEFRDKLYGAYTCSTCPHNSHVTESNSCVCDFGYTGNPTNGGCNALCTEHDTYWDGEQCITCVYSDGYEWNADTKTCQYKCSDNEIWDNNMYFCHEICKGGSYWGYDDMGSSQCVHSDCTNQQYWDNTNEQCVNRCPDGQEFDGAYGCHEKCNGGSHWDYDPYGMGNMTCIHSDCTSQQYWDNTNEQCVNRCPEGQEYDGMYGCHKTCTGNTYWDSGYADCIENCTGGSYWGYDSTTEHYACIHPDCNAPYRWNNDAGTCTLPCPDNYYIPTGTAQCYPHILHIGGNVVYLKSEPTTTPSLNVKIGNDTFYANMTTIPTYMSSESPHYMNVKYNNTTYYVCDDTTYSGN